MWKGLPTVKQNFLKIKSLPKANCNWVSINYHEALKWLPNFKNIILVWVCLFWMKIWSPELYQKTLHNFISEERIFSILLFVLSAQRPFAVVEHESDVSSFSTCQIIHVSLGLNCPSLNFGNTLETFTFTFKVKSLNTKINVI